MQRTTVSAGSPHSPNPVLSTISTNTTANTGGTQNRANGFTLAQAPLTTTTSDVAASTAHVLNRWAERLADAWFRPGGPQLGELQNTLLAMHDDAAVPQKFRDDALTEFGVMQDDSDMPYFKDFAQRVDNAAVEFSNPRHGGSTPIQLQPLPQPVTMQSASGMAKQAQTNWSTKLAGLSAETGGLTHARIADALLDMMEDPAASDKVRAAAATAFVATLDGSQVPQEFFDLVHSEAAVSAHHLSGGAQAGSGVSPARNFGATQQAAANAGAVVPFVRAAQPAPTTINPMQRGPLTDDEAFSLPPRERPMPQGTNPKVESVVQHILQHPDQELTEYARFAIESGFRGSEGSSRKLVNDARGRIAFGLGTDEQTGLLGHVREHVLVGSNQEFGRAASRTTMMKSVAFNPLSFAALEAATRTLAAERALPPQLAWSDLRPFVQGDNLRVLDAMFTKPDNSYATAGPVSPQALAQAPDPAGQTVQLVATELTDPNAKRQRTAGDFGIVQNNPQASMPMPMPMQQVMPLPALPAAVAVQQPIYSPISPATPATPATTGPDVLVIEPAAQNIPTAPMVAQMPT